jgi:hypothetical protein
MKVLCVFAGVALAATANAQFSLSGPGSPVPSTGSGSSAGWDLANLNHNFAATTAPASSSVMVPAAVTCIDSVVIQGFSHTWVGDLQAILVDPNGISHNIFLRPGLLPNANCCGNSGDFTGGDYTFVEAGTNPLSQGPLPTAGNPLPGLWDQSWETGSGVIWPNGDENCFNTPMSAITGPAGIWQLNIYDWAAGDQGSFAGWELNGNSCAGGIGTSYCTPAISNSTGMPGVISADGSVSVAANNVTLTADQLPVNFGYFLTSQTQGLFNPPNSNGFICILGSIGRYNGNVGTGPSFSLQIDLTTIPVNPPVAVAPGETWNFQCWYRDVGNTNNFTDAVEILFL